MYIVFDSNLPEELKDRYIILELDTVDQDGLESPITLYAVVEYTNLTDLFNLNSQIEQHKEVVEYYKSSNWDLAVFNANALKGCWNGELDEFYDLVISTAKEHQTNNSTWTGVRKILTV